MTVAGTSVEVPAITLPLATLNDVVVVTATKAESALLDAPVTMSVITSETLASTPATNYADLLRSVPGMNVIQTSARDINLTSRQSTSTLSNSQLVLLDGRSIYLDFFGLVLWDFLPTNFGDIKQIEVVRGPASAVWGANALTGVVNIITKSPREAPGHDGRRSAAASSAATPARGVGKGAGGLFGANASVRRRCAERSMVVPGVRRLLQLRSLPRPTGQIPVITDPRDPSATVGGALLSGGCGRRARHGVPEPGHQPAEIRHRGSIRRSTGGRMTYAGGVAGTRASSTPASARSTSSRAPQGYGRVELPPRRAEGELLHEHHRRRGAESAARRTRPRTSRCSSISRRRPTTSRSAIRAPRAAAGVQLRRQRPAQQLRHLHRAQRRRIAPSSAPTSRTRSSSIAFRFTIGGRVDKFGNLSDPVFSPRLAAVYQARRPTTPCACSFNRAFRSPSVINNYLDTHIVVPTDLSGLAPLLPPPLRPLVAAPFPLDGAGGRQPSCRSASTPQDRAARRVADRLRGRVHRHVRRSARPPAWRSTSTTSTTTSTSRSCRRYLDPYTAAEPAAGLAAAASRSSRCWRSAGSILPRTAFTYLNLGPLRQKGIELSIDHRVSSGLTAFANYSWQAKPTVLDDPQPVSAAELALPPTNRFNVGVQRTTAPRLLGSGTVNYSDKAFWSDVLTGPYHGFTDAYTMVNGSVGVKWANGRITTLVKVTNLLNQKIQQHVFGDVITRSVIGEVRFSLP